MTRTSRLAELLKDSAAFSPLSGFGAALPLVRAAATVSRNGIAWSGVRLAVAFVEQTRLRRVEVAVETAEGVELWLAELPASLLRAGVLLELDEGSYEIVGFGSSGIVGAPTRVVCRPAPTEDGLRSCSGRWKL